MMSVLTIFISGLFAFANPNQSLWLILLPFAICISYVFRNNKHILLYITLIYSFFIGFLYRYFPGLPYGMGVDGMIFILLFAHLFSNKDVKKCRKFHFDPVVIALFGWLLFTIIQLFNSYTTNYVAWSIDNRALGFYPIIFILLTIYCFYKDTKKIKVFISIWGGFSICCSLWAYKQYFFGLTGVEQAWLDGGARITHVLWGELRHFSILSDAGQFGAIQAHAALIFGLLSFSSSNSMRFRIFYLLVAVLALFGLLLSGTRGPLFIILIGIALYTFLVGKWKIMLVGSIGLVVLFSFLNFSSLGDSYYAVRRLKSSFSKNDASLQIRVEKAEGLKDLMKDRPFGFGIGTPGLTGHKYYPERPKLLHFHDSHYLNIWMSTGIIGLTTVLLVYFSIVISTGYRIIKTRLSESKNLAVILFSGYCGTLCANLSNDLSSQFPAAIILPITLGIIVLMLRNPSDYFNKQ